MWSWICCYVTGHDYSVSCDGGAMFLRYSLAQFAARLAAPSMAASGTGPGTWLGSEAVAARAAFDAQQDDALEYFAPVARTPGFARALARTLQEFLDLLRNNVVVKSWDVNGELDMSGSFQR